MNVKLATTALAALLAAPAAFTQGTTGGAAAPAATRLGALNLRQVIVGSAEGKLASAELQSQFAPRQTEMENLRKQIQDAQTKGQSPTTTDDERNRLARSIDVWQRKYQRMGQELQEDVQAAEGEVANRIGGKIIEVVDRYSRENGFALVIDVSAQGSGVLHVAPTVDITQDITRLYDAANPVRSTQQPARPAAQPGQTRPPTPKPPAK